jgi:hypothetical protein
MIPMTMIFSGIAFYGIIDASGHKEAKFLKTVKRLNGVGQA